MTEADFRDWVRGVLGSLEGRLAAVEARPIAAVAVTEGGEVLSGVLEEMAEELQAHVRGGRVSGLGVVFMTKEGRTHLGFGASTDAGYLRLAGAVQLLGQQIINEKVKFQDAERGRAAA